ncbi:membrane protein [Xanthomonas citri pv. fuscans]|uniref:Membrane protein n=1 Tax=Xanthomonas citri pv. fuscans TaxID=366649 RepID=A0AB34Q6Y5_XANCI|nr:MULTISPECIES: TonB-dependent receptor [Xanthomonas]ATB58828.1 putative TonB-dependent transporter oar-like protein [Xanthomonas citri pv. fuscans]ATS63453.1 TonB-dependent receptor [Xanthomonas citri pv. phaseoli var. fuscans]ATS69132.1 TonB-dependent receptor [Xanthomonas citri pv. phaseoli var. fuscans]ATS71511.1 TonB-dependent receptor [Xanthomonas citri pv. phaseoli var. fuscans]ATS90027.1 TonB-dependent receptor [Xanthomonas citri pv. phaseoli var. fuscans]
MRHHHPHSARPARKLLSCALASCLLLGAAPAFAQSTAATIRGQVTVDAAPAAQAQVTATNLATGLTRTVQVSNGGYSVGGLPPGSYRIDVTANGQTSSQNVTVQVGQTATLNLGVGGEPATAAGGNATTLDAVQVKAPPVLVETRTSENATYISNVQIQNLPRATRNFLELADTVPNVQFTREANGTTKVRTGATSAEGTNVYIDGVSQKNYVLTGGVSGQDSSRGNPFPQSAIGEYKVITSNYKAEFDQVSGAAIVASSKSGTNDFHGSFFWDTSNDSWREESPLEKKAGVRDDFEETQYGATFSGPILKDKAHFFIAYEAKEYTTPNVVIPGSIYSDRVDQLPAQLQPLVVTSSTPFKEDLYFGKIDWTIGENNLFELTGKYRKEDELNDVGRTSTYEHGSINGQEEKRANLRWQYSGANFLNEANLSYESAFWNQAPINNGNGYILSYAPVRGNETDILAAGAGSSFQRKGQKGWTFQDDLTLNSLEWHGAHTVKMGVKFKSIDLDSTQFNPANPQYYYNILTDVETPYRVRFGAPLVEGGGSVVSKNKQYGIYLQDDWEVNEHWTLNLGVRYDYEETPAFLDFVTPSDVASALQNWPNLRNANYNINDFISTGNNRKAFKNAWQPRLGASYDLFGDQAHVIYGGAGRAYDRNIFDYLALEQLNNSFKSYSYYFTSANNPTCLGDPCTAWDPAYNSQDGLNTLTANSTGGGGREVYLIDNNLKTPYSDQFSIGMRNMVPLWGQDWFTDVTLSRIESHDGFAFVRGNRLPDGSFFQPGTTSGVPTDGPNGYSAIVLGTNGVETRNNQLALQVEKPFDEESGWGLTVAYTYSDAKENRQFGEHYALDRERIQDYGWREAGGIPKNRLVVTGIYELPYEIKLSGKLSLASQTARYGQNCLAGNDQCEIIQFKPDGTLGYKEFSIAANKEWDTGGGVKFNVRADILNVFNWVNYATFNGDTGTLQDLNTAYGTPTGVLASPMRTFRLAFGLNW